MRILGLLITVTIVGMLLAWYLKLNFGNGTNNKPIIYQQSQEQLNDISNKVKQYEKSINP
jgi:hypothetical protein